MDRFDADDLTCTECGGAVDDAGYVPARDGEDGPEPDAEAAVCDACGYNDIGMAGCAPRPTDLSADVLLRVAADDDGYEVTSRKE